MALLDREQGEHWVQCLVRRGAQGGRAREQEEHRVVMLDHKRSTGWHCSITRGAQGRSARSQEEYRVDPLLFVMV